MRLLVPAIAAVLLGVSAFSAHADIQITKRENGFNDINVFNEITMDDAQRLEKASETLEYGTNVVSLNSTGGDVFAAIDIGKLLRQNDAFTIIPAKAKCYSSCALIFIAGVYRDNEGELGLHRPYFTSTPKSQSVIEKEVPLMLSRVRHYIAEMGVTDNFYQQMINTTPDQMMTYDWSDYTTVVSQTDPVYDEEMTAGLARRYGTTTLEMRQREQDAKQCYDNVDITTDNAAAAVGLCLDAIHWGLSESTYAERWARAKKVCWYSDKVPFGKSDETTINATPSKLRNDLPVVVRQQNCERDVMLDRNTDARSNWLTWLFGR